MTDLRIPDLGEGVDEGTVLAVLVTIGASVAEGQSLLEVETDKVTFEIPAPRSGVIEEFMVAADAVIRSGEIFARLRADDEDSKRDRPVAAAAAMAAPGLTPAPVPPDRGLPPAAPGGAPLRAGPAARREARELGIAIEAVAGTGRRGRVSREDVRHLAKRLLSGGMGSPAEPELPNLSAFGPVHDVALTRVEQATARNMARGAAFIPHAWLEQNADVTALEARRREIRSTQQVSDPPLTMTAVLCKAVAAALVEFPRFNAGIDVRTQTLTYRDYVNIGVAVDNDGRLLVPVIKDVPSLSLGRVTEELHRITGAARVNRVDGADLRGAGITITNLGGIGISGIQPIINWPEVAILGIASAEESLRMDGGTIDARLLLPITLGFDHRANNGAGAARFLNAICRALSTPALLADFG